MYELSGLPTYDIREHGLYSQSYTLYCGIGCNIEKRGNWSLVRAMSREDVAAALAVIGTLSPEEERRFCEALDGGHSVSLAGRLAKCQDTGEWYRVVYGEPAR